MTHEYIGIDWHKAFFQACALRPTGERENLWLKSSSCLALSGCHVFIGASIRMPLERS